MSHKFDVGDYVQYRDCPGCGEIMTRDIRWSRPVYLVLWSGADSLYEYDESQLNLIKKRSESHKRVTRKKTRFKLFKRGKTPQ